MLLGLVAAQDEEVKVPAGRTRPCKEGEFPGQRKEVSRKKRQAPAGDAPKPCWFIPDETITSGADCEKKFEETSTCEKSQVFVPLGVVSDEKEISRLIRPWH